MFKKTFFYILLCSCCIKTTAIAQSPLKIALADLAKDSLMRHAAWSFRAVNLQTGEVLAEKDADMALITASNMKLVTTAAALRILGAKTRLNTTIYADSIKQNGCFTGRIVIMGGGDPSFCSQYTKNPMTIDSFRQDFFKNIRKAFPKLSPKATLSISVGSIDNETPDSWEYSDLTEPYGAVAKGFNFYDNAIAIKYVANDSAFSTVQYIATQPDFGMKWHDNTADKIVYTATDSTENKLKIVWDINQKWHLEGTVHRSTDTLELAFANPNMRAQLIHNLCDSLHIQPNPTYNLFTKKGMKKVFGYQSAPISELVQVCNEQSNNLYAEAFLKIIAARAIPSGTAQNGLDLRQAFLQQYSEKYGVNTDGTHFVDGCGMSRHNLLTARFLTDFLAATQKDSVIAAPFLASLPIAGETGTLKKWFENQPAKGKIKAKTGTLSRVLAYSGFATNTKNETIAFSLIVNNFDTKLNTARFKLTTFLNVLVE